MNEDTNAVNGEEKEKLNKNHFIFFSQENTITSLECLFKDAICFIEYDIDNIPCYIIYNGISFLVYSKYNQIKQKIQFENELLKEIQRSNIKDLKDKKIQITNEAINTLEYMQERDLNEIEENRIAHGWSSKHIEPSRQLFLHILNG